MSRPSENPLRNLIREIHRRSLWQVLGIYVVASWAVLQVVDTLGGALNLPSWFPSFAFALLLVGLPIVLATAFVQEGGPGEEKGSSGSPPAPRRSTSARLLTWRNAILGGLGAMALLSVVGVGWVLLAGGSLGSPGNLLSSQAGNAASSVEPSVAVLPFEDRSPEGDQRWFSDGVTDQIIHALTRIPDLKVTARTSSFAFRDSGLEIRSIADSLGVANVVEGSVQRSGNRVRISAQLIEAGSGFNLWSETYERELEEIFEVQDEVARAITDGLQAELTNVEGSRLTTSATANLRAHDLYLQGQQLLYRRSPQGIRGAIETFDQALGEDPSYAPAHAGLASAYGLGVGYSVPPGDSSDVWLGRALAYADRALELDSLNSEAYAARGWAMMLPPLSSASLQSVLTDIERALDLRPNYADGHGWRGILLSVLGRHDEADQAHRRALDLDPVAPGRRIGYAYSALLAGDPKWALEQMGQARQMQPGLILGVYEIYALLLLDRASECMDREYDDWAYRAACLHDVGRTEDARRLVRSLSESWTPEQPWGQADGLASYYAWTGDLDRALFWLERGFSVSPYMQAAPGGDVIVAPPGIWKRVLDQGEERIRSTVRRLGEEVWRRVEAERQAVEEAWGP